MPIVDDQTAVVTWLLHIQQVFFFTGLLNVTVEQSATDIPLSTYAFFFLLDQLWIEDAQ